MKQWLLAGMVMLVTLLTGADAMIRKPAQETVLTVSAPETATGKHMEPVAFPYDIPDTTLAVRSLALYEGEMLEVDSDTYLVDAAALELENYGDREVTFAYIVLNGNGEEYHFLGTSLPAYSTSLLIELDGKPYIAGTYSDCTAWVRYGEGGQFPECGLSVTEVNMGTLRVENISGQTLEDILLYYKNFLPEAELYLGGVTYQTYLGTLAPGESMEVTPYRYAAGYSKIIKAVPH